MTTIALVPGYRKLRFVDGRHFEVLCFIHEKRVYCMERMTLMKNTFFCEERGEWEIINGLSDEWEFIGNYALPENLPLTKGTPALSLSKEMTQFQVRELDGSRYLIHISDTDEWSVTWLAFGATTVRILL